MMRAAAEDPGFRTCLKVRLRRPERSRYRKLRHRLLCLFTVYVIDDQAEPVAQIDQGCRDSRSCLRGKYKSCRIFPVAHGERLHFDADRSVRDGRAHLQHMRLQDALFARHQIVGVIFHK